jgi:membrane protein YdbS with pleckstrin-like domain
MSSSLLKGEKVLFDIRPQKKVVHMWLAAGLSIFLLGPLGILIALMVSRSRDIRVLYLACIGILVISFLLLLPLMAVIPPSLGFLAIPLMILFPPLFYGVAFYLGAKFIFSKIRLILTDSRIIFTHGFITDFVKAIRYDRISDVRTTKGALESVFGLRSLMLETLSGQRTRRRSMLSAYGDFVIEGLSDDDLKKAEALILEKMKKNPLADMKKPGP